MAEETRWDKTYKKGKEERWRERQVRVGQKRQWEAGGPCRGENVQLLGIMVLCVCDKMCVCVCACVCV